MWKSIRDWLCPIIIEQEEEIQNLRNSLKKLNDTYQKDKANWDNKLYKWQRDYRELDQAFVNQMEAWEGRFSKLMEIMKENDLIVLAD